MRTSKSQQGVILSINGTGDSYDDAAIESFCSSLKNEVVHHRCFGDQTAQHQCSAGVQGQGLSLMRDNGCQPTPVAFMKACATFRISQPFMSDNNPNGNIDTERLMRTLNEELLWH